MIRFKHLPIALFLFTLPLPAQIAGRNVNMVSGTQWPDGDPFLQRQNEPSLAVSSRNPAHLLGGSNDYRTVDLPGLPTGETGDAWLGIYKSYDGGQTWKSTIHPGCPQKIAACDGAPLLKNYTAGADPVVRAGTSGMFYYAGLGFTRDTPKKSVVFVSRFIDNNNEEGGDPIKYLNTVQVSLGTNTTFLDKPWVAVDIPRTNAATCTITEPLKNGNPYTQTFPAGNIYLAYTSFIDETKPPSQIYFSRSTDCGSTWSKPAIIGDGALNQGAALAVDPVSGAVYATWRRFKSAGITDAIMFAKSTDGGQTFSAPTVVASITPFDQGTTAFSFRTNGYPTIAVDGASRVYLAWTERNQGSAASAGDARVVVTASRDGQTWTPQAPVADYPGRGHQFMPAMNFAGGKLMIIFYDVRQDSTVGNFTSLGGGQFVETRVPAGDLATTPPHPEKVFTNFLLDASPDASLGGLLRRHTIDVWAAQADPADVPQFVSARVSQYIFGSRQGSTLIEQLQVNPPNLPLFQQGTAPFMGDYLDLAASPSFLPGDQPGTWKFNTDVSRSVVFHAVWTDNRDVRPPANGDWTDYTPPISASTSGVSLFDPSQPQPACRTGQAGMRNQNIYTSRITQGLLITSASNAKTLGTIQRSFPIVVSNSTNLLKTYRLTIANQPKGGKASFLQVPLAGLPDPLTVLDVHVGPGSSISRMVFVRSTDPNATVRVNVDEVSAPGAAGILAGGLSGSILLNPDPGNPANPDIANGELFNPDIANPDIANPDIANPDIANPDIANPDIANPDIANPDIANPDIANPDIANPDIANPDIANPDIANPDIANGAMADATWKLTNKGNSTATYTLQFLLNTTIPRTIKTQLIINKTYVTPVSNGCSLVTEPHTVVVANVTNPTLLNQQQAANLRKLILARARARKNGRGVALAEADSASEIIDDSLNNATVSIGPGESINITLRFVDPDGPLPFDPGQTITTVVISHALDTGGNAPPVAASHLIIATTTLPAGVAGAAYDQSVVAAGGNQPYTFSISNGSLPPGLSLDPTTGEITGTITPGPANTYGFAVSVTDSSTPANPPVTQNLSIQVSNVSLAIAGLNAQGPAGGNVKPGDTITVTVNVNNSGSPADSAIPGITINSTGTASANCGLPSPASAGIPSGITQKFTFSCSGVSGAGTLSFSVGLTAIDDLSNASISVSPATSNIVTIFSAPPQIAVAATSGGAAYTPGVWTNKDVIVTFTCTPSVGQPQVKNVTVISEGANQSVTSTCTDLAGNQTNGSFSGINIDKTPPNINMSATSGGLAYFGNFTNQDVIVTVTCSDSGSGATVPSSQQTFNSDGVTQANGTCTDLAGNTSTSTFSPIRIVKTQPTLTVSVTAGGAPYSTGSWSNQSVLVSFSCTPAQSLGVSFLTQPVLLNDGSNQFVSGKCVDQVGNTATAQVGPINVDRTPPTITLLSRPVPNFSGWYNTDVTITWLCTDIIAGQSTVSKTVTTEGANQTVSATCTDFAGNNASASQTVSIDKTPPLITAQVSPTAPASGWNRGSVTVTFQCSDTLSGVAPGNPTGNTTINGDTNGTTVSGVCRDLAGNVASLVTPAVRIDNTAPQLILQSVVPQNAAGWSNGPVTVTWSCNDGGSGPATPTVTQNVSTTGTVTASCSDVAGNSATSKPVNVRIDTTPPFVNVISPLNNFTYQQNQIVFANYTCSDSGSGIATCAGTLSPGQRIDTSVPGGPYTFTVTGTDVAGNQTQVVRTYFVARSAQ
jgi:hypothetical protein